ncbi:alpha/beta fold hydrolase, partial [Halostreptopolyspora alba]
DPRIRRLAIGGVGAAVVELGGIDTRLVDKPTIVDALTTTDPDSVTDYTAAAFRTLVDAIEGDHRALAAQTTAMRDSPIDLGSVTAPTLILVGDEDQLATRPEALSKAIPGAAVQTVEGDHLGTLGDPAFVAALTEFLNH